jgi:hypothetical protein
LTKFRNGCEIRGIQVAGTPGIGALFQRSQLRIKFIGLCSMSGIAQACNRFNPGQTGFGKAKSIGHEVSQGRRDGFRRFARFGESTQQGHSSLSRSNPVWIPMIALHATLHSNQPKIEDWGTNEDKHEPPLNWLG